MAGTRTRLWAAPVLAGAVLACGAAAVLAITGSADAQDWRSARARVLQDVCRRPAPDLGLSHLPQLRVPVFSTAGPGGIPIMLRSLSGRLVETGDYFSVGLEDEPRGGLTWRWRIKARMLALDEEGDVVEEISHDKVPEGSARRRRTSMSMRVGEDPGFYRLDIHVAGAGRYSGRYGIYLKGVSPRSEGRLAIGRAVFRPGETLRMRVENLGTERIVFGTAIFLERRTAGGWTPVSEGDRVTSAIGLAVEGGETGACESVELGPDLSPGLYRVVKSVDTYREPRGYDEHRLTAEFRVLPR